MAVFVHMSETRRDKAIRHRAYMATCQKAAAHMRRDLMRYKPPSEYRAEIARIRTVLLDAKVCRQRATECGQYLP